MSESQKKSNKLSLTRKFTGQAINDGWENGIGIEPDPGG